ncbi:zinc finger protein 2, partial [Prunus dulcis]
LDVINGSPRPQTEILRPKYPFPNHLQNPASLGAFVIFFLPTSPGALTQCSSFNRFLHTQIPINDAVSSAADFTATLVSISLWLRRGKMTKLTILINYDGKWVNSLYKGDPVPVDFTSETQANSGCGDGLIPDDLENDKPHDNIEVYVEHNNLRHDDVPHDNLQFDEKPRASLQFDNVLHDSLQFDEKPRASLQFDNVLHDSLQFDVPCDNMQLDVSLNPPNSPPCAGYSLKLTEKGRSTRVFRVNTNQKISSRICRKILGVNISYRKAWMASQCALEDIRGSPKEFSCTRRSCEGHKKEGIKSLGEEQSTWKCGKCGATGHYCKTYKNCITLHINSESLPSKDVTMCRVIKMLFCLPAPAAKNGGVR